MPGYFHSSYQLQEFNGYLRYVIVLAYGNWSTPGSVSVGKIPMSTFDPTQGYI
jgi:hypothetical protein